MESKAKFLGHPLHQMLIVFPLGLLATAVIFDVLTLLTRDPKWTQMAYYMIGAGLIGGLVAAIFGFIDWLAIPAKTRAKRIGSFHGLGNAAVMVIFALSWLLRSTPDAVGNPGIMAYVLSFLGFGLAAFTGWLGGELVDRLSVGVDRGAHLNSPNSLSGRPASENDTLTRNRQTAAGD
jgi:uncharacterized membrane protein